MLVLILAPLLFAYTWWLGALLLADVRLPVWEKRWLSSVAGFFLLELVATLLCFLGILYPVYIYGVLALFGALAVAFRYLWKRPQPETPSEEEIRNDGVESPLLKYATLCICLAIGIHTLLCALTPEVRSDPIRYHISMANQYAARGGIEPLCETVWWSVPQYAECLYALGISLHNDTLSKLFHWWAGVVSTLGVFAMANRWFGRNAAYWAVLLWATTPMVSYEATTTYVDLILTLWIQLAVWSGGRALERQDAIRGARYLALSGLALGLAFGTKYTAFAIQGIAWFCFPLIFVYRHTSKPFAWRAAIGSLFLVWLGFAPWFLRNLFHSGNPVYPLFNRLFGLKSEVDLGAEFYFLTVSPGEALMDPLYYWEKWARMFHSGYNYPAIAIAVLVFLTFFSRRSVPNTKVSSATLWRPELGFCLASFVANLILTTNMDGRFWLPTLSVFLPFLGEGLSRVFGRLKEDRPNGKGWIELLAIALLGFCVYNYVGQRLAFFRHFQESPLSILSEEARWDYYAQRERGDPNGQLYEALIPKSSIVFGLRFPERVHSVSSDRETVFAGVEKRLRCNRVPLLDPFMESDRTPESFLRYAEETGVEYVVIPPKEKPIPEEFWRIAAGVGIPVEGGKGRLYRIPSIQSYRESKGMAQYPTN